MRIPVSAPQNIWFNARNVSDTDLNLEQSYNDQIQSSTIFNHIGTGVLLENLVQKTLFDSSTATGVIDGTALDIQDQPTDTNLGNQLEVELTTSLVSGKRTVKVFIIGLDFNNELQYDTFTFHRNEKQLSSKHYVRILKFLLNDFSGSESQSFNLGGQLVIREANPLSLDRDCIMTAQDKEPNIFLRDFFVVSGTLGTVLQTALPDYDIDALNITTSYRQLLELAEDDVSSQIGQKFKAGTNNIQKITLLMSVANSVDPIDLQWTGDLIVSIFQLQSTVNCATDILPSLAIEFSPSNIPLAQLSLDYNSLLDAGVQLDETPQPIDFIFSNTLVAGGNIITKDVFYVVSIKRAGSADKCVIQFATGAADSDDHRITLFNGNLWTDIPEESLWFQVWTDAAKVMDGQAYDGGHGIIVPKTMENELTGVEEDFVQDKIPFVRNDTYFALVRSITDQNTPIQDERTGTPVFSVKQFIPEVSLINVSDLNTIEEITDPLLVGSIKDENVKALGADVLLSSKFHEYCFVGNTLTFKIIDDPSDPRYDLDVIALVSELLSGNLLNAKLIPNASNPNSFYRIANAELISLIYGDLDNDGLVTENDLVVAEDLLDADLNSVPNQSDYLMGISLFTDETSLSWQLIDPSGPTVITSGSDGYIVMNPNNYNHAVFGSASADFSLYPSLSTYKISVAGSVNNGNNGSFSIIGLEDLHTLEIKKIFYDRDTLLKIFALDINNSMTITAADISLVSDYVNKVLPFPATTSPANRIGTRFNVIRLTLEQYVDRTDEYPSNILNRTSSIHVLPDVLLDGYNASFSLFSHNMLSSPVDFTITKQLNWYDYIVAVRSLQKLVPASFNYQEGLTDNSCDIDGYISTTYPLDVEFDPGRNDIMVPNNLVLHDQGQLMKPDGSMYKVDIEMATIVLEIPAGSFTEEKNINIFTNFVADFNSNGTTRLGLKAMRFADCSAVGLDALTSNQVRFSVSLQAFSPELDGYDDPLLGVIVDGKAGVSMDNDSGILTLNFTNLYEDAVLQTLSTKVEVLVMLKKAGFNNNNVFFDSDKVRNFLDL